MSTLQAPPGSLLNKAAIISGASRGIGAEIALEFARCGAHIAIVYHSENSTAKALDIASKIHELGRKASVVQVDLLEVDSGTKIVEAARRGLEVDKIDILVNNAGSEAPPLTALEFDPHVLKCELDHVRPR
jgi:3-oxoacyl-[acyl-carrier protein] reductase